MFIQFMLLFSANHKVEVENYRLTLLRQNLESYKYIKPTVRTLTTNCPPKKRLFFDEDASTISKPSPNTLDLKITSEPNLYLAPKEATKDLKSDEESTGIAILISI